MAAPPMVASLCARCHSGYFTYKSAKHVCTFKKGKTY